MYFSRHPPPPQDRMTTYLQSEYYSMVRKNRHIRTMEEMSTSTVDKLTDKEMEEVTSVFRSFETGMREATILPQV